MAVSMLRALLASHGLTVESTNNGHRPESDLELEVFPHVLLKTNPEDLSHQIVLVKELLERQLNRPLELTSDIYMNAFAQVHLNEARIEVGGWLLTDEAGNL